MSEDVKRNRVWAYNIIINEFEPRLREVLIEKILIPNFGYQGWKDYIPAKVFEDIKNSGRVVNTEDIRIFFEELYLIALKEISINPKIYNLCKDEIYKSIPKESFISIFDDLNETRNKIAHAKSTFSDYDLEILIENLNSICHDKTFADFLDFINSEKYKSIDDCYIPESFYKNKEIVNNLPAEDYELDGGYIGRKKEISEIKKQLYSDLDRIISITGAGGLGKTALALRTVYTILRDEKSSYKYLIWFSAKENKLTAESGIVDITSQISDYSSLLKDIANVCGIYFDDDYEDFDIKTEVYTFFSDNKCLLIIDNLETISDANIIEFIKDLPRPSKILITSRKGLGEIERRYELADYPLESAIQLFRIISREKKRDDLVRLQNSTIEKLVTAVKCYPLLIKWSIGKTCLGQDINKSFNEINFGKSEIAQFVFNDIFNIFDKNEKQVLYAMIVYGNRPISSEMLKHFVNFDEDTFDDVIKSLINCSFIKQETIDSNNKLITQYNMLSLTRGFLQAKLDEEDPSVRTNLQKINHDVNFNAEEIERSFAEFNKSLSAYGIVTDEDKLSYNYIKTAKNYFKQENIELASQYYKKALAISPNFGYAINETAKFNALTGRIDDAEKLFKKGIKVAKNSFILSSYGIFLRKNDRIPESISLFEESLKQDPNNIGAISELGRSYTFNCEYEKAASEFDKILNTPNIDSKQRRVTLYYKADNCHRWSEIFSKNRDYIKCLEYMIEARDLLTECLEIYSYDKQVLQLQAKLKKDFGIICLKINRLEEAEKAFKEVMKLDSFRDKISSIKELYKYYKDNNLKPNERIKDWFELLKKQNMKPQEKETLLELEKSYKQNTIKLKGVIRFINYYNEYGVIDYGEKSCKFFLKNCNFQINNQNYKNLERKKVSFNLKHHYDKNIAFNVDLDIKE